MWRSPLGVPRSSPNDHYTPQCLWEDHFNSNHQINWGSIWLQLILIKSSFTNCHNPKEPNFNKPSVPSFSSQTIDDPQWSNLFASCPLMDYLLHLTQLSIILITTKIPTNVPPSITIKSSRQHKHDDSREEQNAKQHSSLTPHKSYSCASIHPSLDTINYIKQSLQTNDWLNVGPHSIKLLNYPRAVIFGLAKSDTPLMVRATGEWLMQSLIAGHTRKYTFLFVQEDQWLLIGKYTYVNIPSLSSLVAVIGWWRTSQSIGINTQTVLYINEGIMR